MDNEKLLEINKEIRKYDGDNSFMISLQKALKSSKKYFDYNGKQYKRLSDRQYEAAINIMEL